MAIRLRARDHFYSDATKQVAAGSEFEVESETHAKHLVDNGLAEQIGAEEPAPAPAPQPAAEPAPTKRGRKVKAA